MPRGDATPWYADGLRFECTACGGCCGGFPGYVWVSREEVADLARRLGIPPDEFTATYCMRIGNRCSLREEGDYDCVMLDDGKCRVYEVRPVQCRTFPFWPENLRSRRAWDAAARDCPGMNRGKLHTAEEIDRTRRMRLSPTSAQPP